MFTLFTDSLRSWRKVVGTEVLHHRPILLRDGAVSSWDVDT